MAIVSKRFCISIHAIFNIYLLNLFVWTPCQNRNFDFTCWSVYIASFYLDICYSDGNWKVCLSNILYIYIFFRIICLYRWTESRAPRWRCRMEATAWPQSRTPLPSHPRQGGSFVYGPGVVFSLTMLASTHLILLYDSRRFSGVVGFSWAYTCWMEIG